jgi:hypothetical protein
MLNAFLKSRNNTPVTYESLTRIFNLSLCTGNFPSKFKLARVTPLYKSGDIADMNNYRPISYFLAYLSYLKK